MKYLILTFLMVTCFASHARASCKKQRVCEAFQTNCREEEICSDEPYQPISRPAPKYDVTKNNNSGLMSDYIKSE